VGNERVSLLLDTHVLLWASEDPSRLGKKARTLLLDETQSLHVSAITTLEIARLTSLKQIVLSSSASAWCERARRALSAIPEAVDDAIAAEAYALPGAFHADPADRILVATARLLGLRLLSADARILAYSGVRSVDARK
jgi:PIN domain nuclease of toxin-antitoxin system